MGDSVVDSVKLEGKKDDMEDSVSSMQNPDANEPEPTPLGNEEQEVKNPAKDLVEPKCTDEVVKEHVNDPEVKEEAILVDDTQHEVKTMDQVNEVPLQMEAWLLKLVIVEFLVRIALVANVANSLNTQ